MKSKLLFIFVVMFVSVGAVSIYLSTLSDTNEGDCSVTAQEVSESLSTDHNIVYLDVRTPEEYKSGHVKNAVLLNFNAPSFSGEIEKLDKDKEYYVYCKAGGRSSKAQKIMQEKGFTRVCNVEGGVLDLEKSGVDLVQ